MKKFAAILTLLTITGSHAFALELLTPTTLVQNEAPGLRVGEKAPDFSAVSSSGESVKLSDLYQGAPVVLIFYRGAWCPYCNLHLRSFQARLAEFENAGVKLLAVSVDKPEFTQITAKEQSLGFDVISDPDASIIENYKLSFRVPAELASKYKNEYGIDLELHSGRTDYLIAVPATYIIDSGGIVQFAYANKDYKTRVTPQQVLEFLTDAYL